MKILLGTVAAIAVSGAFVTAAYADNPLVKELTISGTVNSIATFPAAPTVDENGSATYSNGAIAITALANDDLHPNTATITLTYANVSTNYSAKIKLYSENNGLKIANAGTPPNGFTNRVNYEAQLEWEGNEVKLTTGGDAASATAGGETLYGPSTGDLILNISTKPDTAHKLVEGTYSDKLTLKIGSDI